MMHLSYADKSLLTGDEMAHLLMRYATRLAQENSSDSVTINAIGPDGNDTAATLLLNPSSIFAIETIHTQSPEPDNTDALRYVNDRITELNTPRYVTPDPDADPSAAAADDYDIR